MKTHEQTIPLALIGAAMDEKSLLSRAKSGDDRAFDELMRTHQKAVLGLCVRILGNGGEAEDAAQDVFFKLYRSLPSLDEERRVEPWLFRVAFNVCRDRLRRRRPMAELHDASAITAPEGELRLVLTEVREALRRLTDGERAALLLREVEGLETGEVAARMGSSPVTVRTHISRARAKLRSWLGGVR